VSADPPLTLPQHLLVRDTLHVIEEHARYFERKYRGFIAGDDLRSEGKLALYAAARRFEPARGKDFDVYASYRVKGAMRRLVKAETRQARVTKDMELALLGRMADYADDFDILRHDKAEFQTRLDLLCEQASAAMFYAGAERARREAEQDPEVAVEYAQVLDALRALVVATVPEEREVLDLVFGHGFNLDEAAEAMGVVRKTASRRLAKVLAKLRYEFWILGVKGPPERAAGTRPNLVLLRRPAPDDPEGKG